MSIGERVIAVATVYRILNTSNGMSYIGYSKNWKKRKYEHFHALKKNKHYNSEMQSDFNLYGRSSFKFILLKTGMKEKEAINLEFDLIKIGFGALYNRVCGKASGVNTGHSTTAIPFTWNGITYASISEATRELGVSQRCITYRIQQGYTCDDDITGLAHSTFWNGVEYTSIAEAARENGVTSPVMIRRLKRGYTCDDDIPNSKKAIPFTWNGIKYKSMKYAAETLGVATTAIRYRRKMGYTCDDDLVGSRKITS